MAYLHQRFPDGRGDAPVYVHRVRSQERTRWHAHRFSELVCVHSGSGAHRDRQGVHWLAPGDVLLVRPGVFHQYRDCRGLRLTNVMFFEGVGGAPRLESADAQVWQRLTAGTGGVPLPRLGAEDLRVIETRIDALEDELRRRREGFRLAASGALAQLLVEIGRRVAAGPTAPAPDGFADALRQLAQSPQRDDPVSSIAARAGLSERGLYRAFRAQLGCGPHAWRVRQRLQRACELLREGRSVTDVAFACGFHDSSHFAKAFRRHLGRSPRQWRRLGG
jgi:AraC family L-rhamnose operon transcriptional activator RhaR